MSDVDVVVVGGGAAGLSAALAAGRTRSVLLVVKGRLGDGSTAWAQGGLAAAIDPADSAAAHAGDTLRAGVDLCDVEAVRSLVTSAPGVVAELTRLGARFDTDGRGRLDLGLEGGHHRARIVHAGGDRTGAEVSRVLVAALRRSPAAVLEHATVTDLLLDEAGRSAGVELLDGAGVRRRISARAVVLATGGVGQVFDTTTNPAEATGDGLALALRAGAVVADAEFVQFHPTVLWTGRGRAGQQPLVTEALRGAGAVLVDASGRRLMAGRHPLADLAPRDVVATRLHEWLSDTPAEHAFLDARALGRERWEHEFPTVLAACRRHGVDPVTQPIPVAPGAHYHCGGVRADVSGRTDVAGLFAVGEVARTGMHGANRLASNSLLEALAAGRRAGDLLARRLPDRAGVGEPVAPSASGGTEAREAVPRLMSGGAGLLRDGHTLAALADQLDRLGGAADPARTAAEAESAHLLLAASVIARGALLRQESRGCHQRRDFPATDARWRRAVLTRLAGGELESWLDREERSA